MLAKPEQYREMFRAYRAAHPERHRDDERRRRETHRTELRDYFRRRYADSPAARASVAASNAKWRKTNPGYSAIVHAKRRAAELGASGSHTREEWVLLLEQCAGLCVYCLRAATERDHVQPITRGGSDDIGNLVPACRSCNSSKSDTLLLHWLLKRAA